MNRLFDQAQIRRHFSRAASNYDEHAALQREVESRLLERVELVKQIPLRVLDIGCGPGHATAQLRRQFPKAQIIALDLALPMLQQMRRNTGGWQNLLQKLVSPICADTNALPLAEASIDVLFSSLCLQWCEDLPGVFNEFRRVLKPGGFMAIATLGPDTLHELRDAWASVDATPHVSRFADMMRIGDALMAAGFRDPVLDAERFNLTYADVPALMRDLKGIGASNADASRSRALTGKQRLQKMFAAYENYRRDGVLPATYEVVYAHAWGPPAGQPRRSGDGEIATFSVDKLRGSRRGMR